LRFALERPKAATAMPSTPAATEFLNIFFSMDEAALRLRNVRAVPKVHHRVRWRTLET
jgi:hypothetical protein